jgi:predicted outer membrane repeat protein
MVIKTHFIILLLVITPCFADTIIVDPNVSGDYTTIQAAIDSAVNGQVIVVHKGTYAENINLKGKAITLQSTDPFNPNTVVNTVINGSRSGSCITFNSSEGANTVIKGFLVTNGFAGMGGGIYCNHSSPTLINCTFADNNSEGNGGGMYCAYGNPTLTNCMFNGNNTADGDGGGIYCDHGSPTLNNCTFIDNEAVEATNNGGGMYCAYGNPMLNSCIFTNNWGTRGAGIFCGQDSNPTLNNCTFTSNIAECECIGASDSGGGMYCYRGSSPTLTNCTLIDNEAPNGGGGIYCENGSSAKLAGTIVCRNNTPQIVGSFINNGGNIIGAFCPPVSPRGDLDGDNDVDLVDFAIFAENWLIGVAP